LLLPGIDLQDTFLFSSSILVEQFF